MSGERVRVAVVGAGMMGRFHAAAAKHNGAAVIAVADVDLAKAQSLARELGRSVAVMQPHELIERATCDAVHICTPAAEHAASARNFVERGIHVLCEKPVADTGVDTEELLALASRNGSVLCAVHQFPFQDGVARVLGNQNLIGPVRHLTGEICTAGADGGAAESREELAMSVLPHPLSLFRAFGVRRLAGIKWRVTCASEGELSFAGADSGVGLSFLISTLGRPTRNAFKVIGEHGTGTMDLFHGFSILERGSVSRVRKISQPFTQSALTLAHASVNGARRAAGRETAFPGLRELVRQFYEAVRGNASSPISSEEILDIARARDSISDLCRAS
jgi:predicted dehydrogenase